MGYTKKQNAFPIEDLSDGEYSGTELRERIAIHAEGANSWATESWPEENTLTDAQVKSLDSATSKKNGIGCPNDVASDEPRGFSRGTEQWAKEQDGCPSPKGGNQ